MSLYAMKIASGSPQGRTSHERGFPQVSTERRTQNKHSYLPNLNGIEREFMEVVQSVG